MGLWANMALGFTYLSPLVGVYSLFAYSLSIGGPPPIWWIVIVGVGQFLVSLVFGEVVSQYPLAGGIYPWTRRLWGARYAWIVSWVYIWAIIVTVTAVAEFASGFAAALIGVIALGLYLLLFRREQPFSIFFDSLGAGGDQSYVATFLAASLS